MKPSPPTLIFKPWFCALALVLGGLGLHWWHALQQQPQNTRWWRLAPYLALFPLSMLWGWVDVLRHGLMADEAFNAKFNPQAPPNTPQGSGWTAVCMVLALGLLAISIIASLALLNQLWMTQSIG